MYTVETDDDAAKQVAALPESALPAYAEVRSLLEIAPYSGEPYNQQHPDAGMRTITFGPHGQGVTYYLMLDHQRRVVILRALWVAA